MASEADPYRTLGLTRDASLDEVKRAYRRLAKVNHPDAAGPGALPRFLAIQAAYERLVGSTGGADAGAGGPGAPRRRPSGEDPGADATRRAYGGRARSGRTGSRPAGRAPGAGGPGAAGGAGQPPETPGDPRRGKATLGSTSYDGADAGPFEPDWGGASWYGTTSGTYWTINPKEYADPRKHGPEYQARARRAARSGPPGGAGATDGTGATPDGPGPDSEAGRAADSPHTTSSWWETTSAAAAPDSEPAAHAEPMDRPAQPAPNRGHRAAAEVVDTPEPAPDPARAAIDLARALTDPRSGGLRGRVLRALLGWLPIAFGLGWVVGELTGCGRFAATCDPSVTPLTAIGQGTILAVLLVLPEFAALATGAALVLLVAAIGASLVLSATGTAIDEESRRAALGALLLVAWLSGLAVAVVRRVRPGPRRAGPVS